MSHLGRVAQSDGWGHPRRANLLGSAELLTGFVLLIVFAFAVTRLFCLEY